MNMIQVIPLEFIIGCLSCLNFETQIITISYNYNMDIGYQFNLVVHTIRTISFFFFNLRTYTLALTVKSVLFILA